LVNVVTADDASFGSSLETGEWDAVKQCRDTHFEFIRSKRIAHNDLANMLALFIGQPIGWPSRQQVERYLTLCTDLMDKVHQHYIGCPFAFHGTAFDAVRSGDALINVLAEFAERHDAEVMAGKRAWAIRPPEGFFRSLSQLSEGG
jgi:hypothetical protein